jgi:heat shock protein HslJ
MRKNSITFVAVAASMLLLLAGCAAPSSLGSPDPGLRGQWELISASDEGGPVELSNQRISLTIGAGSPSEGRSTCSDYSAQILGTVASLWVRTSFEKYPRCGNQAQQDLEHRYAADLESVRSATVTPGILHLTAPGIDLEYQKARARPTGDLVGHDWELSGVSSVAYGTQQSTAYINVNQSLNHLATLRFDANGSLTGTTGCHHLRGTYLQNAGELVMKKLEPGDETGCDDESSAVDGYMLRVLGTGFMFQAAGGVLILTSTRAEINLIFLQSD